MVQGKAQQAGRWRVPSPARPGPALAFAVLSTLLCCLVSAGLTFAQAGTFKVKAEHEYVQNATLMEMKRVLRAEAMAKIAAREASDILPRGLSEKRREALEALIKPEVDKYILSFSELGFERKEETCTLELQAEVNGPALKSFLKRWGTYYTSERPLYYSLISPPLSEAVERRLRRLEALSGLERMYTGYPLMTLEKLGEPDAGRTYWRATLKTVEKSWSAVDPDLKAVWSEVWSEFFALPKIQSQTFEDVRLRIQGWTSITAIEAFHQQLTRWSLIVDRASLERVDMEFGQSIGHWQVRTPDREALQNRLEDYLEKRGLTSSLRGGRSRPAAMNSTEDLPQ